EDGIRDFHVTGVQTCALPISARAIAPGTRLPGRGLPGDPSRGPLRAARASGEEAPQEAPQEAPMPYRVLLSTSPPLGQIELSGAVSWAEIDAALRALYGDPAWPPGTGVLLDARAVAAVRVTPGEVGPEAPSAAEATMTALAGARAGGRTAVVS